MYNDLLIYLAEIAKNLEHLVINSSSVTDAAISQLLVKSSKLKTLDISGCPNFCGIAFGEISEIKSKQLEKVTLDLQGYEFNKSVELVKKYCPTCSVVFNKKKTYSLEI